MDAWLSSGLVRLLLGEWDVAIDHFARAMRLSPFEPSLFVIKPGPRADISTPGVMMRRRRGLRNLLVKIPNIRQYGGPLPRAMLC